jgi:hypothetical protein
MPQGEFSSGHGTGHQFGTESNTSLGTSWTAQFEDSTMATTSGTGSPPAPKAPVTTDNITPGQRMVSATAGNVLTGLLGESGRAPDPWKPSTNSSSDTLGCRTSPPTVTIPGPQHFTVYLSHHPDPKKPPSKPRYHLMLSRSILGRKRCTDVHAGASSDRGRNPSTPGDRLRGRRIAATNIHINYRRATEDRA